MTYKVLSILALVALVFSLTATADPVDDEHAARMEILKTHAEDLLRIQLVNMMEEKLRRQDELDQYALQLEVEHQIKIQELEGIHEDKIMAIVNEMMEFVEKADHVQNLLTRFIRKLDRVSKTEIETKEAEPEEDDHVHA